jgi:hypothetical protein
MKHSEVSDLLGIVAANDRRTLGDADVLLWGEALKDIDAQDAAAAVMHHITNKPGEWLTPAHVVQRVRQVHRQRLVDAGPPDFPSHEDGRELSQPEERRYRELWQEQIRRGATREQATAQVDTMLGHRRGALTDRPVAQALEGMFSTRRAS